MQLITYIPHLMFIFLLVFFLIGTASLTLILFISIQEGQWLGAWQNQLRKWDVSGTKSGMVLSKIFGYCELCFSHMIAFVWFWIMLGCMIYFFDVSVKIWVYPIFYLLYVSISTNLNLYFITKLFKQ